MSQSSTNGGSADDNNASDGSADHNNAANASADAVDASADDNDASHSSRDGNERTRAEQAETPQPGSLAALTGSLHLIMPVSAWLGQTDTPGEVTGYGPVDADTCRDLAARLAAGPGTKVADAAYGQRNPTSWEGEAAAIYCRISHVKDKDQTSVARQERICREVAGRLDLTVSAAHVFIDPNRSAWQRARKRPGWDNLLGAARSQQIRHIVAYHPDRLMRQPKDLEELLTIADEHGITLHGKASHRDLSDPDDRHYLQGDSQSHPC